MTNEDYFFSVARIKNIVNRDNVSWNHKCFCDSKFHVMVYCFSGECEYQTQGKTVSVTEGDVCVFPPGAERTGMTPPGKTWSYISILFDIVGEDAKPYPLPEDILGVTQNMKYQYHDTFMRINTLWIQKSHAYQLRCRTIVQEILCKLIINNNKSVVTSPYYNEIKKAKEFIQKNYTSNIVVEDLIKNSGVSPAQFRKLFRKIVGYSPAQYAIFLRLNRAKSLLESGDVNVSEAALLSGFSDVFYFSALYKKKFGFSPNKSLNASTEGSQD